MAASANPVSPKVKSGAIWSALLALVLSGLLAFLQGITPGTLDFLGPAWAPLAYGLVTAGAYAIRAYQARDPLRAAGLSAVAQGTEAVGPKHVAE